jgi:hypothetical protein
MSKGEEIFFLVGNGMHSRVISDVCPSWPGRVFTHAKVIKHFMMRQIYNFVY